MTARSSARSCTGWATAADVTSAVRVKWDRGDVLRDLHAPESERVTFPLRIRLPGPGRDELAARFNDATAWARALETAARRDGWQLLTKPIRVSGLGTNPIPVAAIVPTAEVAMTLLGRDAAAAAAWFADALAEADKIDPAVRSVALARPHDILAAAGDWPPLLAIADWVRRTPRPGIYPRQIPVIGAHTKLIERNGPLLTRMLETLLPPEAVTADARTFAGRFGFIEQVRRVRVRGRAAALGVPTSGVADVEWDIAVLAALDPSAVGVKELLVLENKTSFLTAPTATGRLLLWGAGYGAGELLATLPWRDKVAIRYWGDIDTHGFAILDHVRRVAPHTVSVLMDTDTLLAHRPFWGTESIPRKDPLTVLTEDEDTLYQALCSDAYGLSVRLEQEYIRYDLVTGAFGEVF